MQDWLGQEVKVGSKVVYVTRIGSRTYLHYGEVIELTRKNVCYETYIDAAKVKIEKEDTSWSESSKPRIVGPDYMIVVE